MNVMFKVSVHTFHAGGPCGLKVGGAGANQLMPCQIWPNNGVR